VSDEALLTHIRAIHAETKGGYGWPRVWKELLARGVRVSKDRVQCLMQTHGIKARGKRKFVVTTDSKHSLPIPENLLAREFSPAAPDLVWTSHIICIATEEGWLYLAAVIDLFSRARWWVGAFSRTYRPAWSPTLCGWPGSGAIPAYFSPSWTAFQSDGGRGFKVIVDGVSV
jgi:transposase InsO family protein